MVAIEAVVGGVDLHVNCGLRSGKSTDGVQRDANVLLAKMHQDGAAWLPCQLGTHGHAGAVIGHGGAESGQRAGGAPSQQAAPAAVLASKRTLAFFTTNLIAS